jgi:pyruvate/2-oxoglutarate/acetoin dehydrogenase E1 component
MATLRDTIKEITRQHYCENGGFVFGQCLSAVGWVNGTVTDIKGIVELPMSDVAGAGIAVGAAVAGIRPILVIRFQDFLMLNGSILVNFAAKRKDINDRSCPIWVRALAQEGNGTGCCHSAKLHSTFMHFPGFRIYAPITPGEYKECWEDFMANDDPAICFEHRHTFDNEEEIEDIYYPKAKFTIHAISLARMKAVKAARELKCNFINIYKLKPLSFSLVNTEGLVVDTGFETCSAGRDIAYQLMLVTGRRHEALGLKDISAGCMQGTENLTPTTEEIIKKCRELA